MQKLFAIMFALFQSVFFVLSGMYGPLSSVGIVNAVLIMIQVLLRPASFSSMYFLHPFPIVLIGFVLICSYLGHLPWWWCWMRWFRKGTESVLGCHSSYAVPSAWTWCGRYCMCACCYHSPLLILVCLRNRESLLSPLWTTASEKTGLPNSSAPCLLFLSCSSHGTTRSWLSWMPSSWGASIESVSCEWMGYWITIKFVCNVLL